MTAVATLFSAPVSFGFNLMPGFGPLVIGVLALAILIGGLLGVLRAALDSAEGVQYRQVPLRSLRQRRGTLHPSRRTQQPPMAA